MYYSRVAAAMYKYHFGRAQDQKATPAEIEEVAVKADEEVAQAILSAWAENKFNL